MRNPTNARTPAAGRTFRGTTIWGSICGCTRISWRGCKSPHDSLRRRLAFYTHIRGNSLHQKKSPDTTCLFDLLSVLGPQAARAWSHPRHHQPHRLSLPFLSLRLSRTDTDTHTGFRKTDGRTYTCVFMESFLLSPSSSSFFLKTLFLLMARPSPPCSMSPLPSYLSPSLYHLPSTSHLYKLPTHRTRTDMI